MSHGSNDDSNVWSGASQHDRDLAVARAEIARLNRAADQEQREREMAQAEIERLSTKLSNLRAAAERMVHWTIGITDSECRDIVGALHAAIESSK